MRRNKGFKRLFTVTVVSLLTFLFLFASLSILIGYKVTNPQTDQLGRSPADYGLAFEDVRFYNEIDHLMLSGWWIPTSDLSVFETQKAVIFSHGYGYNRANMPFSSLQLAKRMHEEGYHILMFDFRNSGSSDQAPTTIGRHEKLDLLSAVHYVSEEKQVKKMALMGWSMGAVSAILAGAEAEEVKAVIADSPFADLHQYAKDSFHYWTGLPPFLATGMTKITEVVIPEFKTGEVRPIYTVKSYPEDKGLFLIHSKQDGAIPYLESKQIHNESKSSELWLSEKGGHMRSYYHFQEGYEEKVLDFLERMFQKHNRYVTEARAIA
ncbi:alpha/beta hydrolase [Shouchella shacheensis]|uniref:alpha/beta hydrolase n=1 Tax=Shouchella shacheensis TaxID=1649580 RepID=UPI0007401150|nr:alpha/beta fold hydrolase [Shouchella shacheensis]